MAILHPTKVRKATSLNVEEIKQYIEVGIILSGNNDFDEYMEEQGMKIQECIVNPNYSVIDIF